MPATTPTSAACIEHTVAVTTLAQESALLHPRLNSDLLLCAAILHDIGKTLEFDLGAEIQLSEAGALVGHVALGQQLVADRARTLDSFPDTKLHAISHCILAHHGAESLPGRRFRSVEALALFRLNALDAGRQGRFGARALAQFRRLRGPADTCSKRTDEGLRRAPSEPIAHRVSKKSSIVEAVAPPEAVEELLRQLVDARFVLTDRSGCITRWSRPAEHIFGWPASAMVGRGLLETLAIPGSMPPQGGHLEAAARRKDGSEVQVDLTLVPVQMAHSLEFNGFLEALEIVGPRVAGLERLQESHRTVVQWIAAAIAGRAESPEDQPAGTIVAFRGLGETIPVLDGPEQEAEPDPEVAAPGASAASQAEERERAPPPSGSRSSRARAGAWTRSWPTHAPRSSRCRATWRRSAAS